MKVWLVSLGSLLVAGSLFAHCDWVKGPVVVAAQSALEAGDVTPVLRWVKPGDEKEVREAFDRTRKVRGAGGAARDLADRWFLETVVRLHRAAEGEPYVGLRGEEYQPEPGVAMGDAALASGSVEAVEKALLAEVTNGLRARFAELRKAQEHASHSVEAGRHYVHAYVEFIHYVERLHQASTSSAGH